LKENCTSISPKQNNSVVNQTITGLLQLAAFSFRTIKYWSGFAGDF
jgi:hypothetical protein